GSQAFSMIISGDISHTVAPVADFYADNTSPADNVPVLFTDASANIPTIWSWSFSPSTINYANGTSATSQNPEVEFTANGTYEVSLYAQNAYGNDAETKTGYITVTDAPSGYCEAYSTHPYGNISRVQFGSIDKTSGYTNVGGADPNDKYYEDHTAYSTDVTLAGNYNITVTSPNTDVGLDLGIWIDWNRDGDFEDTGEEELCGIDNGGEGTFSILVPANAKLGNTRMRLRTKYHGAVCNSCGATLNGEVEDYTVRVVATWTGITSDWATSTNWNHGEIPTSCHHLVIPTAPSGGNFPDISSATDGECNDLKIESSANISIFGSLTVSGTLTNDAGNSGIVVESDASATGSLIQSTSLVDATIERYLTQTDYHYISAPVSNQNISTEFVNTGSNPLPTTIDFYKFDEPNNLWRNIKDGSGDLNTGFETQFVVNRGYVYANSNAVYTKNFTGELNYAGQTLNLDRTTGTGSEGCNLVGNPFPASLAANNNADADNNFLKDNALVLDDSYEAIYYWDSNDYISINQASAASYISPIQGFFVKAATNGAQLEFNTEIQKHGSATFYKS
ncbi:MAG: GEVED domain-containing protein, partial [Bacteroidota bacterium]|nr:GEVED domain-containing protein [Bacteroidota bacterium]